MITEFFIVAGSGTIMGLAIFGLEKLIEHFCPLPQALNWEFCYLDVTPPIAKKSISTNCSKEEQNNAK